MFPRWRTPRASARLLSFGLLALCLLTRPLAADEGKKADAPPPALDKPAPESLDDLKAIQAQVKKVLEKVTPSVVGVQVGAAQGSGVIVKDKYVLTAGHVSSKPGRDCVLVLPDGKRINGKTLGWNQNMDSGLIEITDEGKWPSLDMGDASKLLKGQWVLSLGHPGGYKPGRPPVVRLGRVLRATSFNIGTDCTLVGGDSGGPLFDLDGKVIGIHSSIGSLISTNNHVPVDTYRETWDRLVKAEQWGGFSLTGNSAYLGVTLARGDTGLKVTEVTEDSPAAKAGFKAEDVITKFDGQKIEDSDELRGLLSSKKPGDEVAVEVLRSGETVPLKVKLGKRG